jgi:hypothetical protein
MASEGGPNRSHYSGGSAPSSGAFSGPTERVPERPPKPTGGGGNQESRSREEPGGAQTGVDPVTATNNDIRAANEGQTPNATTQGPPDSSVTNPANDARTAGDAGPEVGAGTGTANTATQASEQMGLGDQNGLATGLDDPNQWGAAQDPGAQGIGNDAAWGQWGSQEPGEFGSWGTGQDDSGIETWGGPQDNRTTSHNDS